MAERIGHGAIDLAQEVLDDGLCGRFVRNKRVQQLIDAANVNREVGHRGHMMIQNQQITHSLVQILGRVQAQEFAALCKKLFVIRQNIAGRIGGMALAHIADDPFFLQIIKISGSIGIVQRVFGGFGQRHHGLFVGERGILDNVQNLCLFIAQRNHNFASSFEKQQTQPMGPKASRLGVRFWVLKTSFDYDLLYNILRTKTRRKKNRSH